MKIEKSKLINFIDKYNLSGLCGQVKLIANSTDSTIVASFYDTENRTVVGKVSMANFKIDKDRLIGIFDTAQLLKQLSVLEEGELEFEFIENTDSSGNSRVTKLMFIDSDGYKQGFTTADLDAIKQVPPLKKLPSLNLEIKVNKYFAKKFDRCRSSLKDAETFSLIPDKNGNPKMFMGYAENINTNTVEIPLNLVDGKNTISKVVSFSSIALANVFSANSDSFVKDDTECKLLVSDSGLLTISFDHGDFKSEYFLPSINKK